MMGGIDMKTQGKAWMGSGVFCSLVLLVGMLAGLSGTANALPPPPPIVVCDYDNSLPPATQTLGLWTDIRRGSDISMTDPPCTLNLNGSTGSAGDLWITGYGAPGVALPTNTCWVLAANVLIKRFDNRKAVGFVTNYDEGTKKGLFFGVYDNGNTDALTISAFDGATGQLKTPPLATKALGSKIKENTWYLLELDTCEAAASDMEFSVKKTDDVADPGDCETPANCVTFSGPLPLEIVARGAAGIAGYAKSAFVDSQVRDISFVGTETPDSDASN
jgi:hypothetical protein